MERTEQPGIRDRLVAVTGMGAVCGLGWGVDALWAGLRAGRSEIGPFHRFDHRQHRTHLAAEASPPPAGLAAELPGWRRLSIADRFALFAAREAVARAGLTSPLDDGGAGVFFGSSTGGMYESELFFADFLRDRRGRLSALASQQVNGPGDAVARHLGVTGPVETVSSACASGALALGAALQAIRSGEVEIAVAGGSDSLCQLTYAGFNALRSVDEVPCRPFRAGRAGMSFGEGAAVLVLEPLARALARGAEPLAVLAGAGASCDAHHMTAPDPSGTGAAAALAAALADAGLPAGAIDFVNVHGTGTPLNDAAEWQALQRVFGPRAAEIPLVATKALVGHLLGCSGALEAVATILCLRHGELHPAPGAGEPADPELPVALVTGEPLPFPGARSAVSTSLAFGGSNAALVFSRWTDRSP
ncbi:MAG TPA: beta-ketoacyl-[acyl-carrier-protein] synthase family protein [Thermoanaerobaculia bacterium]